MEEAKQHEREEVAFMLGQYMAVPTGGDKWEAARMELRRLIVRAKELDVLVKEDGTGKGWRLHVFGEDKMPLGDGAVAFVSKGFAWLYWLGMKRPDGSRLVVVCDPQKEAEKVMGDQVAAIVGETTPDNFEVIPLPVGTTVSAGPKGAQ